MRGWVGQYRKYFASPVSWSDEKGPGTGLDQGFENFLSREIQLKAGDPKKTSQTSNCLSTIGQE